jgi:hypothetical protein
MRSLGGVRNHPTDRALVGVPTVALAVNCMIVRFVGGVIVLTALAIATQAPADQPMTPVRPLSPSGTWSEYLEPPAAEPAAAPTTAGAAVLPAPVKASAAPEVKPAPPVQEVRTGNRQQPFRRPRARSTYAMSRLNRMPVSGVMLSAVSVPYTPGFGPAPYSNSGN